jgi:hypothetical protein
MSKMIQVSDVPEHVHGTLKSRAAREGMSLSDFSRSPRKRKWIGVVEVMGEAAAVVITKLPR